MILQTHSQEGLEQGLKDRVKKIVYDGPDAEMIIAEIRKAENKKATARKLGWGLGMLAVLAAPITGGTSLLGLAAASGTVAVSDAVIVAIIAAVAHISGEAIKAINEYKIEKEHNRIVLTHKSCA